MADKGNVTHTYTLEGKDELSGPAKKAASALQELSDAMAADAKELQAMQRAMRTLKSSGTPEAKAAMASLTAKMKPLQERMQRSQAAFVELGGDFRKTTRAVKESLTPWQQFQVGLQAMPGPLGALGSRLSVVSGALGKMRLRTVVLVAAVAALSVALAAAITKLIGFAVASGNARRNELLHFEALTKTRNLWGIAAGSAGDLQVAVDKISGSVSIARGKVAEYATQLYRGGLRGQQLEYALEAASIKASALGEASGGSMAGFAASISLAGGSVKRLAEDVRNRFGGVVQQKMKSLEVQTLKQKENFDSLFDGIGIEAYLTQLQRLRDVINQSTVAGQAMRQLMTIMVKPLIGGATDGMVIMRRFFKQMIIGVQELVIAYLLARNWFRRTFGRDETDGPLSRLFGSFQVGRVVVYVLAAAFGALAVALVIANAQFLLIAAGIYFLIEYAQGLYDLWKAIEWTELGSSIVEGLVNGIKDTLHVLKEQVLGMADSVGSWFKDALGIASPSKVFAELGVAIPQGVEVGIRKGAPKAQAAAGDMVNPATPRLGPPGAAPGEAAGDKGAPKAAGNQSVTLSIQTLNVQTQSDNPREHARGMLRELEELLTSAGVQLGIAEV